MNAIPNPLGIKLPLLDWHTVKINQPSKEGHCEKMVRLKGNSPLSASLRKEKNWFEQVLQPERPIEDSNK